MIRRRSPSRALRSDAVEVWEGSQQLCAGNGALRERSDCDLTEERVGDLLAKSVALREQLRPELVPLAILRKMQAAAAGISDFHQYAAGNLALDIQIPLGAVRRDVRTVIKLDGLPQQSAQTKRGASGAIEAVGIGIGPLHDRSDAVETGGNTCGSLKARRAERPRAAAYAARVPVEQAADRPAP